MFRRERHSSGAYEGIDYGQLIYERMRAETACGPLSLLAVMDSMGVKVTAGERERILRASGSIGTCMLQLKEVAE